MINSIIESISISLNTEFGDTYKIYKEEQKQGLEGACFFIQCLNCTNKLSFGKKYFRENQFCIRYFPRTEKKNEECYIIAECLFLCLEHLTLKNDLVMGTKMKYELMDGILNFFVNYDMFVYKAAESIPFMEEFSSKTSLKG